jgi:hypothetical protein
VSFGSCTVSSMAVGICLFLRYFLFLIVDAGADGKAQWSEMAMGT